MVLLAISYGTFGHPHLWYFWPPPLMVLLATPLMDLSTTHLAESFRIFVFRFLALAKEVPYVFLSKADSKAPAKVSRRLPIAIISQLPRRLTFSETHGSNLPLHIPYRGV